MSTKNTGHGYDVLLLEDDEQLASLIVRFLSERNCTVTHAADGKAFTLAMHHRHFDLILADVVLPDASGFQLLQQHKHQLGCPLIFMSALSSIEDQVCGLELGACDYLVKPVDPELLWAKIEANLRHIHRPSSATSSLNFGPLSVDTDSREARVNGTPLPLTSNEFDLLMIFADQPTQLLSREYLFRRAIGREFDGLDRVVDMRVSRLRKKLAAIPDGVIIRSIRGRGYSLNTVSGT